MRCICPCATLELAQARNFPRAEALYLHRRFGPTALFMTPPSTHPTQPDAEGLLQLLRRLTKDVIELVSNEFELARAECSGAVSAISRSIGAVAIAIAVWMAGTIALTAAVVLLLMQWLPAWLAAAITGAAMLAAGALLIRRARGLLSTDDIMLARTRRSLMEDVDVAKGKTI
jgi:uncharacterized membrane protein YqjE